VIKKYGVKNIQQSLEIRLKTPVTRRSLFYDSLFSTDRLKSKVVPLFSIYWYFEVVNKIADSLKAEFEDRNIQVDEERPGFTIGNVLCILGAVSFGITVFTKLFSFLAVIMSILSVIVGITSFILFIMYWVKINGYRNKLVEAKRAA
jgi:hypothetical protein